MKTKSPLPCPNTVTVRRNPHRRARATPSTNAPQIPVHSPSSTTARGIPSFPMQDILSIEIPQKGQNPPQPVPSSSSSSSPRAVVSQNLKVYLRIRPLLPPKISGRNGSSGDQNPRLRTKNAWPQNPAKKSAARDSNSKNKNCSEVCIAVNDSHSVKLSPPSAVRESKRIKSEVYEGFSHVFPSESPQDEVYQGMVKPLVDDFLKGKSGMLAALGPTGSGKTHTVFGSPREPGMVPLALQQIFKQSQRKDSASSRSFSISIFEIYSEGGKGEKLFDLSPDGTELSMQQSSIKGLQEVVFSDAGQAESLIARAMLKRATAMTNANRKSSRSQCIINISSVANKVDEVHNNAVLTIVDLAGAERGKKTGNRGARLLETNFINNTSMVFGLCLRSLLEHQKNPKKPLQKHFHNSLLTKYLRDYLEGKKRMALILTVRAGEEDYLDTSYLLKQASPFMNIKFKGVEESSTMNCNKRHFQALSRVEQPKRMKLSSHEPCVLEEGKSIGDEHGLPEEEAAKIYRSDAGENATTKSDFVDGPEKERNHQILQNFTKAMWNVLKQYKQKLQMAKSEIQSLRENLNNEKTQNLALGKDLENLRSCCTCPKVLWGNASMVKTCSASESTVELKGLGSTKVDEGDVVHSSSLKASYLSGALENIDSCPRQDKDVFSEVSRFGDGVANASETSTQQNDQISDIPPGAGNRHSTEDLQESKYLGSQDIFSIAHVTDSIINCSQSHHIGRHDSCSSVELDQLLTEEDEDYLDFPTSPKEDVEFSQGCSTFYVLDSQPISYTSSKDMNFEKPSRRPLLASSTMPRDCSALDAEDGIMEPVEFFSPPQSREEHVTFNEECGAVDVPDIEPRVDSSSKQVKPKRRLLPASSILLRDFGALDVEDDLEKPKGNRAGRKLAADERKTTEGSISLLRLLRSNRHI